MEADTQEPVEPVEPSAPAVGKTFVLSRNVRVRDPIEGYPPGTLLPESMFPDEPTCPFCLRTFSKLSALKGHAYLIHGIKWEGGTKNEEPIWMTRLTPWQYWAMALRTIHGLRWPEIAERLGKSEKELRRVYKYSPVAKEFCDKLKEMFETPEILAQFLLKANSVSATIDFLMALEWAKEARDYKAVSSMSKDLLEMNKVVDPRGSGSGKGSGAAEVHIHLDTKDLSMPTVRSSYEELGVPEADWEEG